MSLDLILLYINNLLFSFVSNVRLHRSTNHIVHMNISSLLLGAYVQFFLRIK